MDVWRVKWGRRGWVEGNMGSGGGWRVTWGEGVGGG